MELMQHVNLVALFSRLTFLHYLHRHKSQLMIPIDDSTYQRRFQLIDEYLHFLSSLLVARKTQLLAVTEPTSSTLFPHSTDILLSRLPL